MGFNCLKATTATSRRQFTFYHSVPRNSWYSFYRPRKDERLSRPWSHPVVLNTGLLDWESSTLIFKNILPRKKIRHIHSSHEIGVIKETKKVRHQIYLTHSNCNNFFSNSSEFTWSVFF